MESLASANDSSTSSSGSTCPDPLWDPSLTWHTSNPNLTECLRFTVLAAVPVLVLLLHLPGYVIDSRRRWHDRSLFADERAAGGIAHWVRTILSLLVAVSAMAKFSSDERRVGKGWCATCVYQGGAQREIDTNKSTAHTRE